MDLLKEVSLSSEVLDPKTLPMRAPSALPSTAKAAAHKATVQTGPALVPLGVGEQGTAPSLLLLAVSLPFTGVVAAEALRAMQPGSSAASTVTVSFLCCWNKLLITF